MKITSTYRLEHYINEILRICDVKLTHRVTSLVAKQTQMNEHFLIKIVDKIYFSGLMPPILNFE